MLWNAVNGTVSVKGTEMPYVSFGKGKKNLIILPGLSDGLTTVRNKALLLAAPYRRFMDDYTVYMFSRRENIPEGYTICDMADDQAEALSALGLETAAVLGVSQGGMIALALAVRHPQQITKAVIAVSAPCVNPLIRENVSAWITMAENNDHKQLMISTAEKSYSEKYLKKYRRMYPLLGMIGNPKDYRRFLVNAHAILNYDLREEIRNITCPVLIIGGEDDRIVGPQASLDMHQLIAGSELHMYPGLGHAAYEEADDFNDRVFGFLQKAN